MKLEGMIFDLDGTLGDTLPVCYAGYREVFWEFLGRRYTDQEIAALFGPNEEGIFRQVVPDRWEAALASYQREYRRAHTLCPAAFPGIEAALQLLKQRGLHLGIVTGKGPESTAFTLEYLGLASYFGAIGPGDVDGAIKPQAIRRILSQWGIAPDQAAYIGDMAYDMRAAKEVGVVALGAAWAETMDIASLEAAEPLIVFRTVEAFADWIEQNVNSTPHGVG